MKKLIVHIEYEEGETDTLNIQEALDLALDQMRRKFEEKRDIGWRYFESLDEAMEWEAGDADVEVALKLVGRLRRMIGTIAAKGTAQPH